MKQAENYVPLQLEIVEVQMEKGYAESIPGLGDINPGGGIWD